MSNNPFILSEKNPAHKSLIIRKGAEKRFKLFGFLSVFLSISFLVFLLYTIIGTGIGAFERTMIKVRINMEPELVENELEPTLENIETLNFRKVVLDSFKNMFPKATSRSEIIQMQELVSRNAYVEAKNKAINKFRKDGTLNDIVMWLPASSGIDMLIKGNIDMSVEEYRRKVSDFQAKLVTKLKDKKSIKRTFNWHFLTESDSREPEVAGIYGSIMGSFFLIIVCMITALPIGIGAALYLEEFAKKSRLTTIVEIGINT
jgi:phosphate transport system permease protein